MTTKVKDKEVKAKKEESVVDADTRKKAFDDALAQASKKYGDGAVQRITGEMLEKEVDGEDVYSFGILQVDRASKLGGAPRGKIIEVYGPESSGKTTLCLHTCAEVMKKGGNPFYIDAEHALGEKHISNCGALGLVVSQPDNGEQALDLVEFMVDKSDLIVVDSVSALVPKAEIDGQMGEAHVGLQARLMSQALRKLTGKAAKSGCTIIFVNQIRHKIGVMFGSPETTSGGNALKFYASMRIDMRRKEKLEQGGETVANRVKVKFVKNKAAPPFGEGEFYMFFDASRTVAANALEFGVDIGVVDKSGSWYSYKDERLGQGVANAVECLVNNREMLEEIVLACRQNLFKPVVDLSTVI